MIILYVGCPGELIQKVSLVAPEGQVISDEDDRDVWVISSQVGSRSSRFEVGQVPEGFEEELSLASDLSPDLELAAVLQTTRRATAFIAFRIEELRSDQVLTTEGRVSVSEFEDRALERCS